VNVFWRVLAFLVALILCLPGFLLPISTSVPAPPWIILVLLAIGLIVLQFSRPVAALEGTLIVCILAVLASQSFAATPAIKDANGQAVPGSIATLEEVNLNGTEDAHALTLMLRERFHQDKIYIYGASWTSILGIWLIQRCGGEQGTGGNLPACGLARYIASQFWQLLQK